MDQAGVIVRELSTAAPGCSREDVTAGERALVELAPSLTVTELRTLAGQVRDRLDLAGTLPREVRQRARRSLASSYGRSVSTTRTPPIPVLNLRTFPSHAAWHNCAPMRPPTCSATSPPAPKTAATTASMGDRRSP